jgi:uncharacterized peroxidase-related enzyme
MNRYPAPDINDLPDDIKAKVLEVQAKAGFVPNVFLALARRPAEWRAFFAYHDALMLKEEGSLTKGEREMIVTTTSAANHCLYCVVAHGAIARVRSRDPYLADQLAVDWRKAPLSPRMHAVIDVAVRLAVRPAEVTADDLADLAAHGLTTDDVWDVGAIVALFALSNRLAHWAAIPPNEEFFLMGRVPRA